jgi:hypothetical protein
MAGFMTASAAAPITRQGSRLNIPIPPSRGVVVLPRLCVRCGAAANGKPVERVFYWHHPAIYLLIFAGLVIYAIVALVVRKGMKLRVPLCAQHAQRRNMFVTLAWVLPLIGIADAFVLPRFNVDGGIVAWICVVVILSGLIIWAVVSNPVTPKFIDATRGEFTGFCETYLQQFPVAGAMTPALPQAGTPAPPGVPPPPIG